jgi:diguanylate cyclase (GGDEF)-like protein/PAS domain S-box-containing protein
MLVAGLYYAGARLGLLLAFEETNASPVWPPSGIAFAAVLLLGYRVWPGIWLGAFLANVVVFLANQTAGLQTIVVVSSVIAIGNTLEALTGGFLLRRFVGTGSPLDRDQDVIRFVAAALLMCAVSPSIGPSAITLGGMAPPEMYGTIWFTWWLGDTAGVLVVTPLVLAWGRRVRMRADPRRLAEAVPWLVLLVVSSWVGFGGAFAAKAHSYPLAFLPLPFLVWAAFRFGHRGATTAIAMASGIAVWKTVHGLGPFAIGTMNESLLLLQGFVGVVTVTILTTAAVVYERRQAEEKFRLTVEAAPNAMVMVTRDGKILLVNSQIETLFGYKRAELIGQSVEMLVPERFRSRHPGYRAGFCADPQPRPMGAGRDLYGRRKDGSEFPVEIGLNPIETPEGVMVLSAIVDITARKRLEPRLVHLASHDPLTDLFNRHHFQEELGRQIAETQRYGTHGALLFLDLDKFKDVNDSHGHLMGDELLASLAKVLRERLRETDLVARLGGDEFAVLLPYAGADQARAVAGGLLESVRRHVIAVDGQHVGVTASIGVVLLPEHGTTVRELFARADLALYQAKEKGRNGVAIFTPDREAQAEG